MLSIHAIAVAAFRTDVELRRQFEATGYDPSGGTPAEFEAFLNAERQRMRGIIAASKMTLE